MKRLSLTFLSILLTGFSLFASDGGSYKIRVKIKGVADSACYLANNYGEKQYLKDTAKADKNGNIIFDGKPALPGGVYMVVIPGKRYFEFIVDKEQNFSIETDTSDFLKTMKFKGSPENDLFYEYMRFMTEMHSKADPLRKQLEKEKDRKSAKAEELRKNLIALDKDVKAYWNKITTEHPQSFMAQVFIRAMMEPEIPETPKLPNGRPDSTFAYRYYKAHYFDNVNFTDDRILRVPAYINYHTKLDNYFKNMVIQIPDSIIPETDKVIAKARANNELLKYTLWYLSYTYETSNIMGMEAVFSHVVNKYFQKPVVSWLDSVSYFKITSKAKKLAPLLLGKKAPQLVLEDTSGNFHSLYNLKSKYVVILFWDPDCGHCQKEVPRLAQAYDSLKAINAEVMAVMCTPEAEKWKKFIREHKLKWLNVGDPGYHNYFREIYDLNSYPQIYIIDENKEIIARRIATEQVTGFLYDFDKMLKKRTAGKK